MNTLVHEDMCIDALVATLARSRRQINATHESDAELIRIPGSDLVLALTTDSIVEEVETGLYDDPRLIGWMTVAVNLSDLAAVGADPLGILLNVTVPANCSPGYLASLRAGVDDACRAAGTTVLGGDTNFSDHPQFGGTAVGLIDGVTVTRRGAKPGDLLFATGPLGAGSAFALRRLKLRQASSFRPAARLHEGRLVRRFASCAMDTSDGLLATLDQLVRINGVGFEVDMQAENLLQLDAEALALANGIPPWVMLAGPHGEFELTFTVPPLRVEAFLNEASRIGWEPVHLGRVVESKGVDLLTGGSRRTMDTEAIRGLAATAADDVDQYLTELLWIGS